MHGTVYGLVHGTAHGWCMAWCMAGWCGGVELMWWYTTWIGEVGLPLFLSLVLLRLGGAVELHNREILSGFI